MVSDHDEERCEVCGERLRDDEGVAHEDIILLGCCDIVPKDSAKTLTMRGCIEDDADGNTGCGAMLHVRCIGNFIDGMIVSLPFRTPLNEEDGS